MRNISLKGGGNNLQNIGTVLNYISKINALLSQNRYLKKYKNAKCFHLAQPKINHKTLCDSFEVFLKNVDINSKVVSHWRPLTE